MNWGAVGAVAELLGAIGVIVSLVYLARQIGQNTRAVRVAAYQSWFASYESYSNLMLGDPEFASLLERGIYASDSLPPDELARLKGALRRMFRQFENLYHQHQEGMIEAELFDAWAGFYSQGTASPAVREYWESERHFFSASFRSFADRLFVF